MKKKWKTIGRLGKEKEVKEREKRRIIKEAKERGRKES